MIKVRLKLPVFIGGMIRRPGEEIAVPENLFSSKAMERVGYASAAPAPETEASAPAAPKRGPGRPRKSGDQENGGGAS